MQRDSRAYLADILESCDAISTALSGMQIEDYLSNRLVRSSVEHKAPDIFESITNARRIVDFRNRLTHEYPTIDDELVWALAMVDLQVLRRECAALLSDLDSAD